MEEHGGQKFQALHEGAGSVLFDEKRIRQVLLNLLANALAVSPPEGVVTVRSRPSATEWRGAVEDEGPGLPPDQHERVFNPFVSVNPRDPDGRGSGLGL